MRIDNFKKAFIAKKQLKKKDKTSKSKYIVFIFTGICLYHIYKRMLMFNFYPQSCVNLHAKLKY